MKATFGFLGSTRGVFRISLITASEAISASVRSLRGAKSCFWKSVPSQPIPEDEKRKQPREEEATPAMKT